MPTTHNSPLQVFPFACAFARSFATSQYVGEAIFHGSYYRGAVVLAPILRQALGDEGTAPTHNSMLHFFFSLETLLGVSLAFSKLGKLFTFAVAVMVLVFEYPLALGSWVTEHTTHPQLMQLILFACAFARSVARLYYVGQAISFGLSCRGVAGLVPFGQQALGDRDAPSTHNGLSEDDATLLGGLFDGLKPVASFFIMPFALGVLHCYAVASLYRGHTSPPTKLCRNVMHLSSIAL